MNALFEPGGPLCEPMRQVASGFDDRGRSHIVLIRVDDAVLRQETSAELADRLSGRYALRELDYTRFDRTGPGSLSLPRFCRTLPHDPPACVFGSRLEGLKREDAGRYEAALHFLNAHREDIRLARATVVLWLTIETYKDLWARAPDFASWRTADATFSLPDGRRAQDTPLGGVSLHEAEALRDQARRLEEMCSRDGLEPAMRAELEKQRARAYARLGREEDHRAAVEASSRAAAELDDHDHQFFAGHYRQHVIDRFGKLTLYSIASDTPLAVDLEQIFVKLAVVRPGGAEEIDPEDRAADEADPERREPGAGLPEQAERHWRRAARERPARRQEGTGAPLSIGKALAMHRDLAIVGAPGSGKTTLLRYIALSFARGQAQERLSLDEDRLPLLVTLRDFSRFLNAPGRDGGDRRGLVPELLSRFLRDHTATVAPYLKLPDDFFSRQLDAHDCIVLLDGLDEVADPAGRDRVAEAVAVFAGHYRRSRFVLSSRPRGYEGEARRRLAARCADCTIRDFDDEDMGAFATNWYAAVTRERLDDGRDADAEARSRADDLLRAIRADGRVRALARTPLLLSVLAMVHQRGLGLPQRRVELYDACTDMLLGYWDQVKGGDAARELARDVGLDRREMRTVLEPIALWFHERGGWGSGAGKEGPEQGVEVGREELEPQVARHFEDDLGFDGEAARRLAGTFLQVIEERAGLLVEREPGVYGFAHLTFQEYLAARALADREDYIERTLRHLHDPWWREVILLEVGHLGDVRHSGRRARKLTTKLIERIRGAGSRLEDVLKRDLLFAARALTDIGPLGIDEGLRRRLLDEVLRLCFETPYAPQREEIGKLLSYAAPTASGGYLAKQFLYRLKDSGPDVRRAAAKALGQLPAAAATEGLLAALEDSDRHVPAAKVLGKHPTAAATEGLLATLEDHPVWSIRRIAARALGAHPTAAATEGLLAALEDSDSNVRWSAVVALGKHPTAAATKGLLAVLEDSENSDLDARRAAATILGKHPTAAVAESLLAALEDPDWSVRRAAAEALGKHPAAAAAEGLLAALEDPDRYVRRAAAEALGEHPTAAAAEGLLAALEDSDSRVRWAAAMALGKQHPTAAATEGLLAILEDHPVWFIRRAAAEALGKHPTAAAAESLRAALEDPDRYVRRAAAEALGKHPTAAATEGLLAALEDSDLKVRRAAAEALGEHPTAAATEGLLAALEDSDSRVRWAAAMALGKQHPTAAATEGLLAILEDHPVWFIRRAAAEALGKRSTAAATAGLLAAFEDPNSDVREAAAMALGNHSTSATASDALLLRLEGYWRAELPKSSPYGKDTAYTELRKLADAFDRAARRTDRSA